MYSKLKFLIDSLKDELNSGNVPDKDREELRTSLREFLGSSSESTSITPGLEDCIPTLAEESETNSMNLFDSDEDELVSSSSSSSTTIEFMGDSEQDVCQYKCTNKAIHLKEKHIYSERDYEDFKSKERFFKERKELRKRESPEELLEKRFSFKELLKSDEDALLNKRCKNILNSFLLFGKSYKDFVENCIDCSYYTTNQFMGDKLFDYKRGITFDKTCEIFKFVSDKFDVDLRDFEEIIRRCFNRYCAHQNCDFRFGRDFDSYYRLCTNREELSISHIPSICVRDLGSSYSCHVRKTDLLKNLKYCFNPSALDGSNIYEIELIHTYRSLLKGTIMFKYLCRLNRFVGRLVTRVIWEHDGIVSLKEKHKVEIESLFKYCSYAYISELIKIYSLIDNGDDSNLTSDIYEYYNKLI